MAFVPPPFPLFPSFFHNLSLPPSLQIEDKGRPPPPSPPFSSQVKRQQVAGSKSESLPLIRKNKRRLRLFLPPSFPRRLHFAGWTPFFYLPPRTYSTTLVPPPFPFSVHPIAKEISADKSILLPFSFLLPYFLLCCGERRRPRSFLFSLFSPEKSQVLHMRALC